MMAMGVFDAAKAKLTNASTTRNAGRSLQLFLQEFSATDWWTVEILSNEESPEIEHEHNSPYKHNNKAI